MTTRKTKTTPRALTADETYALRCRAIEGLLGTLRTELDLHAERQAVDQKNWGLAGDLGQITDLLAQAVGFMQNREGSEVAREYTGA